MGVNIIKTMEEEIIRLQKELDKATSERKALQNESLICDDTIKIDILGTEYKVVQGSQATLPELADVDGYTDTSTKTIVVDDMKSIINEKGMKKNLEEHKKAIMRHEVIHAFLFESGLAENSNTSDAWAVNEEMVDWLAIQAPKIYKTFQKLNII
nr:MAG TPA: Methyltransferase FkbM domain [Bacteriophage sp.]